MQNVYLPKEEKKMKKKVLFLHICSCNDMSARIDSCVNLGMVLGINGYDEVLTFHFPHISFVITHPPSSHHSRVTEK